MVRKLKNKSVSSQGDLIQKAKVMQENMLAAQESLKDVMVETSLAGEQIKIKANAQNKILEVKLGKEILEEAMEDPSELEDLIKTAINDVLEKAKDISEKEIEKVTGGFSIPGLF